MDELDFKILNALRNEARRPFLEIAKELEVADATIHVRVKKMLDEGIIKSFDTSIDYRKLGYEITSFIEIKVKPGTIDEAISRLKEIDGVLEAYEIHGHCDIMLKVKVKALSLLRDTIVNEIRKVKDVISSESFPVLRIVKEERNLPLIPI